jgi:site-specific recombinase XerC
MRVHKRMSSQSGAASRTPKRTLKAESLKKIRDVVEQKLLGYCATEGFRAWRQLDIDVVREFRNRPSRTSRRTLAASGSSICAHSDSVHQSGWMQANPATVLQPPKADHSPKLPIGQTPTEVIIAAADAFTRKGQFGSGNRESGLDPIRWMV